MHEIAKIFQWVHRLDVMTAVSRRRFTSGEFQLHVTHFCTHSNTSLKIRLMKAAVMKHDSLFWAVFTQVHKNCRNTWPFLQFHSNPLIADSMKTLYWLLASFSSSQLQRHYVIKLQELMSPQNFPRLSWMWMNESQTTGAWMCQNTNQNQCSSGGLMHINAASSQRRDDI